MLHDPNFGLNKVNGTSSPSNDLAKYVFQEQKSILLPSSSGKTKSLDSIGIDKV
jgi:hypothetical protein